MTDNQNIPKHWQTKKLGEVCLTTSGGTPSRKNPNYYVGNIPWVKSGELGKGLITNTEEKISEEAIKNSSAKIFPKGTLLIALYGATIGKLGFLSINAATNQAICGIFQNKEVDLTFLSYYLILKKQKLIEQGIGGAQPNISQTILKQLPLPIPPLSEQQSIVSKIEGLFSELDNGVAQLKTAQQQLKTYRQAVLKAAFQGKLTEEWRKSESGYAGFKDEQDLMVAAEPEEIYKRSASRLTEFRDEQDVMNATSKTRKSGQSTHPENPASDNLPEGWRWVKIGDVGDIETGTTPTKKVPEYYGNDFPFYKPTDLEAGYNVRSANDNLSKKGIQKSRFLPIDSILVTCIGATIGKTGIIRKAGASNQQINSIIPSKDFMPNYVYYQVISTRFQEEIKMNAASTTLPILNKSKFQNINFVVCSKEEQQQIISEIETRLSVADNLEQNITQSLQQAEALRQSILKQAFEGRLMDFQV